MRNDLGSSRPARMIATLAATLLLVGFGCSKAPEGNVSVPAPVGTGQQQTPPPSATGSGAVTESEGVSLMEGILGALPDGAEVPSVLTAEPASLMEAPTAFQDPAGAMSEQERRQIVEQALLAAPPIVTVNEGGEEEAP